MLPIALGVVLFPSVAPAAPAPLSLAPASLIAVMPASGVAIVCQVAPEIFPLDWRSPEIDAQATPLDPQEILRSQSLVAEALALYPAALLQANLRAVYVARAIQFYGLPFGGTNSRDALYIANDGQAKGYTDQFLRAAVHHELSSILLRNHPDLFPRASWIATLPEGFEYQGDGTQAIREGSADTTIRRSFVQNGFLNQYATASLEEDFNMVAESLLTQEPVFLRALQESPRLARKAHLVARFYQALDPDFPDLAARLPRHASLR